MVKVLVAMYPQRGYLAAAAMMVVGLMLIAPVLSTMNSDEVIIVSAENTAR